MPAAHRHRHTDSSKNSVREFRRSSSPNAGPRDTPPCPATVHFARGNPCSKPLCPGRHTGSDPEVAEPFRCIHDRRKGPGTCPLLEGGHTSRRSARLRNRRTGPNNSPAPWRAKDNQPTPHLTVAAMLQRKLISKTDRNQARQGEGLYCRSCSSGISIDGMADPATTGKDGSQRSSPNATASHDGKISAILSSNKKEAGTSR